MARILARACASLQQPAWFGFGMAPRSRSPRAVSRSMGRHVGGIFRRIGKASQARRNAARALKNKSTSPARKKGAAARTGPPNA